LPIVWQVLAATPRHDTATLAEWALTLKDAGIVRFKRVRPTVAPGTAEGEGERS
jgi:hypothetical protein